MMSSDEMLDVMLKQFEVEIIPQIEQAHASTVLFSGTIDAKLCLEVGAIALLNKPLLLIVLKGSNPPLNLMMLATKIIQVESMKELIDDDKHEIQNAITEIIAKAKKDKEAKNAFEVREEQSSNSTEYQDGSECGQASQA